VNCAACGTANDVGRKFCMECGSPLALTCPSCGSPNPPASKFCGECGSALSAGEPRPPEAVAASPTGVPAPTEHRLVSVLFLDLVSFTTLSEQRDAEDMRALLDTYFETARTVIGRHGGVVEKFIGDAVMAVWGTPVTHEDDAERAVRASLELVDAVEGLGATAGAPLQARAGVLTGEAATTPGATDQGMVTGDMVNTAARLQSAAAPGQVFVGESTYRAASRAVAFELVGDLTLKGKEAPVRAWRALRVVAERQGANRMTVEPPFVGRTEELRLLKELLHATGREGKPRVVSVTGIGGIGKSRLAWELLKYVDGLSEDIWWHQGRCPAYGDGITFWALGEMVRMRARIAETDPAGVSRTKLAASLAEHVPDEDERRWLEPRLAFLLGLGERPAGGREELFAAWRAFFERLADEGPVAMVFEDLQWADAGLLDFIDSMLEWSRAKPIFVVTLARPELADRRPNWGAGQRSFVSLHLEPLPDEAMSELVRGLLPDADPAAVARIVERAEGVPLYAVETIRMLADRGVLRAGEDAYELVGDLGELEVPETLHALVASRLDNLDPDDRILLQGAAVLGQSFTLASLGVVADADPTSLEPRLADLVRKEFLEFEADPRSPERGQYVFVQAIIREVAYGMLSKADRRSRHLTVAHHFESLGDDELAGAVAAHYVEALRATPEGPDADALGARARDWLRQAAERATALGSPDQALVFVEQALGITPSGGERAALLEQAANSARDALRDEEERLGYLRQAIEAYRLAGDVDGEIVAMGQLADRYGNDGMLDELRATVAEMQERLGDGGNDRARAELAIALGWLGYYDDDLEGSLASVDRALGWLETVEATQRLKEVLGVRTFLLALVGRRQEAMTLERGLLAVATLEDDLRAMSSAMIGLGLAADEVRDQMALSLEAAAIARRGGIGRAEMVALANALEFSVDAGGWDEARAILTELRGRSELPETVSDTIAMGEALLAAYQGNGVAAEDALGGLSEVSTGSEHPTMRAWIHRVRSIVRLMAGDPQGAYDEAMTSIDAEPEGPNSPAAVWAAGQAALSLGDAGRARAPLDRTRPPKGSWIDATRRAIEAGIGAIEGHPREAATAFDELLAGRIAKGDPFTHAQMTTVALSVLPSELVPEGTAQAALAYLEGIGAHAMLALLTSRGVPSAVES
jgi:class 3 adenylate cyclase/tetratricopeptide (TPR) repeat protein